MAAQRREHLGIVLGDHQRVYRGGADVPALAPLDQLVHNRDRAVVVHHRHRHAEDRAGREVCRRRWGGLRLRLAGVHVDRWGA
jgi:hypothetical protein